MDEISLLPKVFFFPSQICWFCEYSKPRNVIFIHHPSVIFLQTLISEQTAAKLAAEFTTTPLQGSTEAMNWRLQTFSFLRLVFPTALKL